MFCMAQLNFQITRNSEQRVVPKGSLKIARRLNAGKRVIAGPVPQGRLKEQCIPVVPAGLNIVTVVTRH
jgi:hypothetical protein